MGGMFRSLRAGYLLRGAWRPDGGSKSLGYQSSKCKSHLPSAPSIRTAVFGRAGWSQFSYRLDAWWSRPFPRSRFSARWIWSFRRCPWRISGRKTSCSGTPSNGACISPCWALLPASSAAWPPCPSSWTHSHICGKSCGHIRWSFRCSSHISGRCEIGLRPGCPDSPIGWTYWRALRIPCECSDRGRACTHLGFGTLHSGCKWGTGSWVFRGGCTSFRTCIPSAEICRGKWWQRRRRRSWWSHLVWNTVGRLEELCPWSFGNERSCNDQICIFQSRKRGRHRSEVRRSNSPRETGTPCLETCRDEWFDTVGSESSWLPSSLLCSFWLQSFLSSYCCFAYFFIIVVVVVRAVGCWFYFFIYLFIFFFECEFFEREFLVSMILFWRR